MMNVLKFIFRFPILIFGDIAVLIPLLLAFSKRKILEPAFKYFYILLFLMLALNLISIVLATYRMNNLILGNLLLPIQFGIILRMFSFYLNKDYQKKILLIIFVFFILIFILDFFTSNPNLSDLHNHRYNKYSYAVQDMLIMTLVLYYFYRILVEVNVPNLLIFPIFWISCGLLLYHAGSVFVHIFYFESNTWKKNLDLGTLQQLPSILSIFESIFFTIGLWFVKKDNPQ